MHVFDEIGLNPDTFDRNIYLRVAKTLIRAAIPEADSAFDAASIAAEDWLNIVAAVVHFAKRRKRNVDAAYRLLMPTKEGAGYNLLDSYGEHAPVLREMIGRLAELGRPVRLKPLAKGEYPLTKSSAHEAALSVTRLVLEYLVCPIANLTDADDQWRAADRLLAAHWKKFEMSPAKVASLQERIRTERLKMLRASDPTMALTEEDVCILTVLDLHYPRALTHRKIELESVRINREEPKKFRRRLNDSAIRKHIPILLERRFVAKPPRTQKKGIAITEGGRQALRFATANSPQS